MSHRKLDLFLERGTDIYPKSQPQITFYKKKTLVDSNNLHVECAHNFGISRLKLLVMFCCRPESMSERLL